MMDAETAKKLMRHDELIEMRRNHTDAEWSEFLSICDWLRERDHDALRKEWHQMKIDSLVAGGLQ